MPHAIQVTKDTIPLILMAAESLKFDLGYLDDNMKYAADFGENLYLITGGTPEQDNLIYTTLWETDFRTSWQFTEAEDTTKFVPIERV